MRILTALGSCPLLPRGTKLAPIPQLQALNATAHQLARLVLAGNQLVVTHGNAAQLGVLGLQALNGPCQELQTLDVLQAQTQAWLGYKLELALRNALPPGAMAVSMLTQTKVDPRDRGFHAPGVPVGPVFDQPTAERLAAAHGWKIGPAGRGWCRLVPFLAPAGIIELDAIHRLVNTGVIVICGGGGGVPVSVSKDGRLTGLEAVVDRHAASAYLAARLDVDFLLLLNDTPGIYLDYGGPEQRVIACAGPDALAAHIPGFSGGSMRAQAEAACAFARETGKQAAIGRIEDAAEILAGWRGTLISSQVRNLSFHDEVVPV